MTTIQKKTAVTALAAFSLVGTLAGCATATTASTDTSGDSSSASSGSGSVGTTAGSYTDGDYEATGSYQSPGGTESIDVKVTLADGVVTAVEVTGTPSGPDATHYQADFESGISAEVVGKSIDSLSVDKIGGSSLTSGGFNDALATIKSDAAA